ncbi:hypothetical protein GCM10010358_70020 [Streptomyces minutiscleroticus]|uniref:Uncharacterized protein n=1 Tax=Streptomyces minutiscleroticus TaxID=68238 RepID=A0A918U7R6_9ACTN|nr:hypothetical protein [Streptomyces minutiscleroticus]GGY06767.1 hypothetical protein GCM10010358_70020 [Streptomyces minutiscleroticus]
MNLAPIHPAREQPVEPAELKSPAPFFELCFAELGITLQRPLYRLFSAVATIAVLVSLWWIR